MSAPAARQATARSPFAGCAIFICVFVMMIFLIVMSVVTFFRQYAAIEKFTFEQPAPVEVSSVEDREAELNQLAERLENFRQQLIDDKDTSLALTADDINTALAVYEPLKELRGTFRVREIGDKDIRIDVSFPLNGKPRLSRDGEGGMFTTDNRYLNGTLAATPELFEGEVVLQISAIEVPGKTVVPEFVERMSPHRITERYKTDPVIGAAMKKLTGLSLADGTLILRRQEGEKILTTIDDKQVDSAAGRMFKFFAIGASFFLLFAAVIIFLGLRRKPEGA